MSISVALCTYNGEKFIESQLLSILDQSSIVTEVLICDDASLDSTVDIITDLINKNTTSISIKLIVNKDNIGAIHSFEKCIKLCSGNIIFLSDQDDIWHYNKVEKFVKLLSDDKSLAIFSDGDLIDNSGMLSNDKLWMKWGFTDAKQKRWQNNELAFSDLLFNHNVITGATLAFKKELLQFVFPFEFPLGYWHDAWIGLVAASLGGLRFLPESTICYRIHNQQQVGITAGAKDKKFEYIAIEDFIEKIYKMFPDKKYILYPEKSFAHKMKTLCKKIINKIRKI